MPPPSPSPIAQLTAATGALLLFGAVQTAMLSWGLAKGERLRQLQIVGLLVAIGGLVYMLLPGLSAPPIAGAAFMIAAGIAWAGYSLLGRGVTDPTSATAGNFIRSVPFAAALSLAMSIHTTVDPYRRALRRRLWRPHLGPRLRPVVRRPAVADDRIGGGDPAQRAGDRGARRRDPAAEPLSSRLMIASVTILGGIALTILRPRT